MRWSTSPRWPPDCTTARAASGSPDFGDDALPLGNAARVAAAALPFDEQEFYASIGGTPWGDPAYTVRELTTIRPTIELNGMWGGYTGAGSKDGAAERGPREDHHAPGTGDGPGARPDRAAHASAGPSA